MTTTTLTGLPPTHPGEILREDVLPAVGKPKAEIASLLGISRQHLHDLLAERKPVTTQMAFRLARMFGGSAELWLRLQMAYDLRTQAPAMTAELERIPQLATA